MTTKRILGCTGHRPHRLGGHDTTVRAGKLLHLAMEIILELEPDELWSGVALGWDQAFALAGIELGIPVTAAIPFDDYDKMWAAYQRREYEKILARCKTRVVVTPGEYTDNELLFTRNRYVVDHVTQLAALYDGKRSGGTFRCLEYAAKKDVPHENMWDRWLEVRK